MTVHEYRPGTLKLHEIPDCLNRAIVESGHTRWHLAATMSELTGEHITKMMLDAWTAPSKPKSRFPYEYALPRRRRRLAFFVCAKCRRPAWERMTLPVAVILNRLAAAFLVLMPLGRRI